MSATYFNDADLEMIEAVQDCAELDAETCAKCGEAYQSITFYVSGRDAKPAVEAYECSCGHRSVWINGGRLS